MDGETRQLLEEIRDGVGRLETWKDVHDKGHEALDEKVRDHQRTLYGNGEPGLKSSMQGLETQVADVIKLLKPDQLWKKILVPAVASLLATAGAAVIFWFFWLAQIHAQTQ